MDSICIVMIAAKLTQLSGLMLSVWKVTLSCSLWLPLTTEVKETVTLPTVNQYVLRHLGMDNIKGRYVANMVLKHGIDRSGFSAIQLHVTTNYPTAVNTTFTGTHDRIEKPLTDFSCIHQLHRQ